MGFGSEDYVFLKRGTIGLSGGKDREFFGMSEI